MNQLKEVVVGVTLEEALATISTCLDYQPYTKKLNLEWPFSRPSDKLSHVLVTPFYDLILLQQLRLHHQLQINERP